MIVRTRRLFVRARERVEGSERMLPLRGWLRTLSDREIELVDRVWQTTRHAGVRKLAFAISWLGNGSFYVLCAVVLIGVGGARPVAVAALAIGVVHLVYPWIKLACGRLRPFEIDPGLTPLLATLDRHSFPSGHAMTLTAALVPVLAAWPAAWPLALVAWLVMAWSRVATAHHYPSDIVAGALLGGAVATPLAKALMP